MIQQINYIVTWKAIRDAAFDRAIVNLDNPFISTYNLLDTICFLTRESGSC